MSNLPDAPDDAAYDDAVRRVLWGEPEGRVIDELQKEHHIPEEEARALHGRAMMERVAVLREGFRKRTMLGLSLLCASLLVGAITWEVTQGFEVWTIPGRNSFTGRRNNYGPLAVLGGGLFLLGVWLVIDGVAGWLTAETRAGAVADEEE